MSGSLPSMLPLIGNGRLEEMFIHHNKFSGTFPGGYENADFLQQLEL